MKTSVKQFEKKKPEITMNIIRSTFRAFLWYEIVKVWTSSAIQYISLFCHQQIQTIPFNVYFYIVRSMFLFLFNRSQSKAGVVNQMNHVCFGREPAIGQFNVQTAIAKKKNYVHWVIYNILNLKVGLFLSVVWEVSL